MSLIGGKVDAKRKSTSVTINPVEIDLRKVIPLLAQPRVPLHVTGEALPHVYSKLGASSAA